MGIKDWLRRNATKRKIFDFLISLSNIGLWGFLLFALNIHLSHVWVISNIYHDYEIDLDKPSYNEYYNINDTFQITFILYTWAQPLDAEFDINLSKGITARYYCNALNESCPKSPYLSREFLFKNLQQPQYITVQGIFSNSSGVANVCLLVDEPRFHENSNKKCVKFNPSGLYK